MYARVSTEHEVQINALENQLEWYKIECSQHSDWEIVEVYVDQGITGTQAQKRPEFLRMMENAKKGKFDLIITREVSRFARNTVDALSYTRQMKAMGVDVHFINDGINTAADDGDAAGFIIQQRKVSFVIKGQRRLGAMLQDFGVIVIHDRDDFAWVAIGKMIGLIWNRPLLHDVVVYLSPIASIVVR